MKKVLLMVLFATIAHSFCAQTSATQHEIGLITSDFDSYGLSYKVGTTKSLWRFSAFNLSGSKQKSKEDSSLTNYENQLGLAIKVGKEFRKLISKNLEFIYGADLSLRYTHSGSELSSLTTATNNNDVDYSSTSPGLYLIAGLSYVINNKFRIGAELNPGINYWLTSRKETYFAKEYDGSLVKKGTNSQNSGIGYTISSSPIQITLAYRLNFKKNNH